MTAPILVHCWNLVWPYITLLVTIASAINTLPQPAPGSHWTPLRKVIAFIALNIGGAASESAPPLGAWLLRVAGAYLKSQGLTIVREVSPVIIEPKQEIPMEKPHPSLPPNLTEHFVIFIAAGLALGLGACSTQATKTALTVACAADNLAPAAVKAGTTIALIADPASVAAVQAINAADAAAHPVVQAACAAALAGSTPVPGTVAEVSVPVGPPVSQTTLVILPTAPASK